MTPSATGRPLVVGVGRRDRGDDGVGPIAVRLVGELAGRRAGAIDRVVVDGDLSRLLDLWRDRPAVAIIDAAVSGAAAGSVRRLDAGSGPLPTGLREVSSHGFGLAAAVELARSLGRLPPVLRIWAIEGASFERLGLSAPVARAAETVAREVVTWLASGDAVRSLAVVHSAEAGGRTV